MKTVYLGLGSNVGDRQLHLRRAIERLSEEGIEARRVSAVYETEPVDYTAQPWFLNCVVEAETELMPLQLLNRVLKVEARMGRRRMASKGPRTIDIDILLYGNHVMATAPLTVPHARLAERRFVLEPLRELAPDLRHPVSRKTISELYAGLARPGRVVRYAEIEPRNTNRAGSRP